MMGSIELPGDIILLVADFLGPYYAPILRRVCSLWLSVVPLRFSTPTFSRYVELLMNEGIPIPKEIVHKITKSDVRNAVDGCDRGFLQKFVPRLYTSSADRTSLIRYAISVNSVKSLSIITEMYGEEYKMNGCDLLHALKCESFECVKYLIQKHKHISRHDTIDYSSVIENFPPHAVGILKRLRHKLRHMYQFRYAIIHADAVHLYSHILTEKIDSDMYDVRTIVKNRSIKCFRYIIQNRHLWIPPKMRWSGLYAQCIFGDCKDFITELLNNGIPTKGVSCASATNIKMLKFLHRSGFSYKDYFQQHFVGDRKCLLYAIKNFRLTPSHVISRFKSGTELEVFIEQGVEFSISKVVEKKNTTLFIILLKNNKITVRDAFMASLKERGNTFLGILTDRVGVEQYMISEVCRRGMYTKFSYLISKNINWDPIECLSVTSDPKTMAWIGYKSDAMKEALIKIFSTLCSARPCHQCDHIEKMIRQSDDHMPPLISMALIKIRLTFLIRDRVNLLEPYVQLFDTLHTNHYIHE